ncbi:MAG TPA: dihydropteroate synthase [Fimbriimonadaceae bacterium]|nr:dihydropteroate synthase [Fimbriimonadaceae bacterium]
MSFPLPEGRPALMGILNVTPDSFSDGGRHFRAEDAVAAARRMIEEGADLIDVGGESTRPGAAPVSADEEMVRVLPVLRELARRQIPVSIDTMKPEVAKAALAEGARVVNDVSGFRNPQMVEVVAASNCSICIMHMLGEPRTMQKEPVYADVLSEVTSYLRGQARTCEAAGIARDRIWIDPGIGFGKTVPHNLALLRGLPQLAALGYPVLVGVSRKSFIGRLLGSAEAPLPVEERLEGTLAAQVFAQLQGTRILRAHDVRASRRAMEMTRRLVAELEA